VKQPKKNRQLVEIFRPAVGVVLTQDRLHWVVFVSRLELRDGHFWVTVECQTDQSINGQTVNLSDYTMVKGGGARFTSAKMKLLKAAHPKPKATPPTQAELLETGAAKLRVLWGLAVN
jgi:hypothetical protein